MNSDRETLADYVIIEICSSTTRYIRIQIWNVGLSLCMLNWAINFSHAAFSAQAVSHKLCSLSELILYKYSEIQDGFSKLQYTELNILILRVNILRITQISK